MTYLNLNQLSTKLGGRSRSSILRDIEAGRLPKPIKFGSRLYWVESEIDAAVEAADQRDAA
ncbi:MAG: AlpA family phage regulatory protein [Maritimibacter sp.]|uniref:helix-turn-helix transcriptional regulator n=1 Tax=Maritimibacter sp. TaxID=2003363 RepID=UPI001DAC8C11|nr:AlpA family phage regulatory protein [Maritimibacter sp.]MBL6427872.1 AlpA family phage regulatory protein [Maritimibacter sp.]